MGRKPKNKKKKEEVEEKSKRRSPEHTGLAQETKNGIWGVVCLGFVVLTTLAFFGKAGVAGDYFSSFARSLFGWGIFLIPVSLLMVGISFFKSISREIYGSLIIGTSGFLLSFLAIFYIFGSPTTRLAHSGYLGLILGYPLYSFLGFPASLILLVLLGFISFLVVMNIPIHTMIFKQKDEEDEKEQVVAGKMQDSVIIKRGNEVIDLKKEEAEEKRLKSLPVVAKKPAAEDGDKEFVIKASRSGAWTLPPIDILHSDKDRPNGGDVNTNAGIIKRTLANFGIDVEMGEVSIGPTVTQFTLRPAVGVKLSKITTLVRDLSLALAAHPIRIEAPIPGKSLVGIEVPNKKSAIVGLRDLIDSDTYQKSNYFLPIALGRDVAGFPVYAGIEKMPHMLVAGATGTGKSVGINSLLLSLLFKHSPDMLKLILIDPKRVELTLYNDIPHLITPVITEAKKVVNALKWAVREMEKRYERLQIAKSRDIFSYNAGQTSKKAELMPFIVIVIDELADIMASHGRDVEAAIVRLAQMSRAVGIHLVVSTQRPSVEVITGLIKANITSRVAFQVASQIDSRTILDTSGAEQLLGNGDLLFIAGDTGKPKRIQGPYVSEKEVKDVVKFIKQQADEMEEELGEDATENDLKVDLDQPVVDGGVDGGDEDAGDALYGEAKEVVSQAGKASASLLQRRLKVGYARAARLLDLLEERGIIGPGEGAKPREVYVGAAAAVSQDDFNETMDEPQVVTAEENEQLNEDLDEKRQNEIATE